MKPFAFLAAALLVSSAAHAAAPLKKSGGILVDDKGMTVYTFDKDNANSGKSACMDGCLKLWPAVAAPAEVSPPYSAITRDDGMRQLAYKGKPLYYYAKDSKPGERTGDNFKDVWHVVKD